MNIPVWAATIWRFKWISLGGFLLACLLAVFATARVSFSGGLPSLSYRTPEIYTTETKILVTQAGFPWGRTVLPGDTAPGHGSGASYADPSRFVMLAGVYATLANSDQIQRQLVHPQDQEALTATPEVDPQTQSALPIIDIVSLAPSQQRVIRMARQASSMLKSVVETQQKTAGIPANQRVLVQTLQAPYRVTVAKGRKKTVPIVVFMTVLLATLGLVLALENIWPRVRLSEVGGEFSPVLADEHEAPDAAPVAGAKRPVRISSTR
jgi:hypothetical protein